MSMIGDHISYDLHLIDHGVNIAGACNASFIVITFNAFWLINHVLALTPPGIGVNVIIGLGRGVWLVSWIDAVLRAYWAWEG
jgi:hypothetical protein